MFTANAILHDGTPHIEDIESYETIRQAIDAMLELTWEDEHPAPVHVVDAASKVVAIIAAGLKYSSHDGLVYVMFLPCGTVETYRVTYELVMGQDNEWHYESTTVVLLVDESAV